VNASTFRLLISLAAYLLLGMLPVLWILFTDRFRHAPSAQHYAVLFLIVALLGFFLFLPAISIVAAAGLLAVGLSRLSAQYALHGVTYRRRLEPRQLFAGDKGTFAVRLVNAKLLPLAWITAVDPIHFAALSGQTSNVMLRFSAGMEAGDGGEEALVNRTALAPFQALERTYEVEAIHRGVYTFGPVTIRSGDPFGFFPRERQLGKREEFVVYPRLYAPEEIGFPFHEAIGETLARQVLVEDPTLIAGARPYQPGDPLRRIHWKATAHTNELQVRVADASTTAQIMLLLNLATSRHVWEGIDPERLEVAISLTGTIVAWALERDLAVGLHSNGVVAGSDATPRISPSANPHQLTIVLEQLARITFAGRRSIESMVTEEARRLGPRGTLIVVTPYLSAEMAVALTSRTLANRVSVVYCGKSAAPVIPGLRLHVARLWNDSLAG